MVLTGRNFCFMPTKQKFYAGETKVLCRRNFCFLPGKLILNALPAIVTPLFTSEENDEKEGKSCILRMKKFIFCCENQVIVVDAGLKW